MPHCPGWRAPPPIAFTRGSSVPREELVVELSDAAVQSEECGCAVGLRNGLLLAGFAASVGQMVRKRWALVPKASSGAKPRVIESSIEVAVPVSVAYSQWTQFEEFPRFMQGVDEVRQL
jgi:uncharacterized membrane protein